MNDAVGMRDLEDVEELLGHLQNALLVRLVHPNEAGDRLRLVERPDRERSAILVQAVRGHGHGPRMGEAARRVSCTEEVASRARALGDIA